MYLAIYPNKRRKTPLITLPYSLTAYVYYKTIHPEWIIRLEDRNVRQDTRVVKTTEDKDILHTQEQGA